MRKNLNHFSSPVFVFALLTLLVNDFILKHQFHNLLTGKLSDFAGLYVFSIFWAVLFPSRKIIVFLLTALAFIWWKSDLSESFIRFFTYWIFPINRVVDLTDLIALLILPFAFQFVTSPVEKGKLQPVFLMVIAVFSFCATSVERPPLYLDQPQYVLFEPAEAIFAVDNEKYDGYQIDTIDGFFLVKVSNVFGRYSAPRNDDFEKKLILKSLDDQLLNEINYKDKYVKKVVGSHQLQISGNGFIDSANFKGTRLDGRFVRRNNQGKVIIEGFYQSGIEDSTWKIIDTVTQIITLKKFSSGEITEIQHLMSGQLLDKHKVLTRSEAVNWKYVHLAILFSLVLFLVFLLYRNYRMEFSDKLRLGIGYKIFWSAILPLFVFLVALIISKVIPNSFDVGGDIFRLIGNLFIIYIVSVPFCLLIFFTISVRNIIDFIWYCILFALLINVWWEFTQLSFLLEKM